MIERYSYHINYEQIYVKKGNEKMKKMNRIIAGGLALLSMSAMLGGCKTVNTANSGDVPTLVWYVPGDNQQDIDSINEAASKITEEKIGAKIQMTFISNGSYGEKISMINASSEKYDLCFTGYLSPYLTNAQKGSLLDITEMLKDTPELVKSLPDFVWDGAKIDDRICAVPNYQILATTTGLSINKELADKYNLNVDNIKKTEDIEPFLEQVAKNESGVYPFRANWGVASFTDVGADHSDNYKGQSLIAYVRENGKIKVVPSFELGNSKEKAKKLYAWYQNGYIRKDSASVMDDSQDAKAGKYAVQMTAYKPGVESEDKIYMGGDVYSISLSKPMLHQDSIRATMIGIGANSKNPEKALKFIELINTDKELYNLICFGIEGKHYNKVGENRIELIENSGYNPNAAWKFGNQFNAYLLPGQADDVWEQTKQINESAEKVVNFGFDPDYTAVRTQQAQCSTVISEYKVMNTGAINPDEYFDDFEKKLYDAGLQDIINEIQSQVDKHFKQ